MRPPQRCPHAVICELAEGDRKAAGGRRVILAFGNVRTGLYLNVRTFERYDQARDFLRAECLRWPGVPVYRERAFPDRLVPPDRLVAFYVRTDAGD